MLVEDMKFKTELFCDIENVCHEDYLQDRENAYYLFHDYVSILVDEREHDIDWLLFDEGNQTLFFGHCGLIDMDEFKRIVRTRIEDLGEIKSVDALQVSDYDIQRRTEETLILKIAKAEIDIFNLQAKIKNLKAEYLSNRWIEYQLLKLGNKEAEARGYMEENQETINGLQSEILEFYSEKYGKGHSHLGVMFIETLICRSMILAYLILKKERGLSSEEEQALTDLKSDLKIMESEFKKEIVKS